MYFAMNEQSNILPDTNHAYKIHLKFHYRVNTVTAAPISQQRAPEQLNGGALAGEIGRPVSEGSVLLSQTWLVVQLAPTAIWIDHQNKVGCHAEP